MTKRTLTLIESRKENLPIINDFAAAAKRHHWAFHNLENINSDNISRYDLDDLPLDFVIYRALSNNYAGGPAPTPMVRSAPQNHH